MNSIPGNGKSILSAFLPFALIALLAIPAAEAATYVNASTTFNWIDASSHTKVGYNTAPYRFNGLTGCGTTPPVIDDTLSDVIPLGFNFSFGGTVFDAIRIMTNGRIHFVSTTLPLDNTTCGFGSPVTQLPYMNATLTNTMRIYGNDMDPTLLANYGGSATPCVSANTCYVSFASIGTAPNRQFVVTWNNVPEWAGTTSNPAPTGNYNLQIILNEAGDFIYQYGTDTPGPSAALGQVGWEVSSTDFDIPAVGYPVPNTAVHFFIPHPVVEYLMEQPSWSGGGTVLDTSGSANNGSPVGTAQTVAGGRVCRGVNVSATGTNAIDSGLSVPSVIGNAGTIAFWYKANTAWSGAGTQSALLLDATTINNQWFFLTRRGGTTATGGGRLRFVITDSTGTARVVETAAITVAANTWRHIAVTWSFNNLAGGNNDHLRIYVDGVQQQQTAFTSTTTTLSSAIGSLYIGGSRSGLVGPSSTVNSADATLDEFRTYNYEAAQATIAAIMNLNTGGCLNHYSISNGGTGSTCLLSPFTFAAHTQTHGAFVNNALVTLSTSDGTGTWSLLNGHGVVTNTGTNTGDATYLFNNESQAVIGLVHPTIGTVTAHITDGTYAESENTALVISNCQPGKFNACELTNPRCVPSATSSTYGDLYTKLANTAFALDIVALNSQLLDTTFNGRTVTVALLANTTAPTSLNGNNCPPSQTAVIPLGNVTMTLGRAPAAGVNVAANAFSNVSPNYSAYRDVRVRISCSGAGCGASPWCATDPFTVRPQSFTITSSANADNAGASTTLTPAVKAGTTFTLTANTATAGYDGTPNIDTTMSGGAVEWPGAPGGGRAVPPGTGTLSGTFTTAATLATGNEPTGSNFTYDEVGYFRFKAGAVYDVSYAAFDAANLDDSGNVDCINTPPNDFSNTLIGGKYGCKIANQAASNYFGRFIPDHFAVTNPALAQGCVAGDFTYMDQDFNMTASIEAQNAAGTKTQNYSSGFAKGVVNAQAENNLDGVSLGSRLTFASPWTNGAAAFSATKFSRPSTTTPDATWGPYDKLAIGAVVSDSDGPLLINRDMDQTNTSCTPDSAGTSNGTCPAATIRPPAPPLPATLVLKQRMGALRVSNSFGSELLALPVPLQAQYWSNGSWVTNISDSCTSFPVSCISMGSYTRNLAACETVLSPNATLTLNKGVAAGLRLSKPGAGNDGTVTLTVNSGAASGNTCLSAAQSAATSANLPWFTSYPGRATFGVYKGNKEFIYMRETY